MSTGHIQQYRRRIMQAWLIEMTKTDDNIFLISNSGELEKVPLVHYDSENLLQTLIEKHPEILAGDQIGGDESVRWFLVKREAGIPDGDERADRWSVDHLAP